MKKALLGLAIISQIFLGAGMAQDVITKVGPRVGSISIEVKEGEVCEILNSRGPVEVSSNSFPWNGSNYAGADLHSFLSENNNRHGTALFPIAGPLWIHVGSYGMISYRIRPNISISASTPANAVVIPTDATGSVQVILESSTDLITWTQANPGTYGASTAKRFFRIRAVNQ